MERVTKTEECNKKLMKIQELFDEADTIFNTMTDVENHAMLNFHEEGTSLNHCIRWGFQAANELVEAEDLGAL